MLSNFRELDFLLSFYLPNKSWILTSRKYKCLVFTHAVIKKNIRTSVHFLFISHLTKVKLSIPHYIKIDFLFIYQNHDIFTKHQTWMSLRPGWYLHAYTSAKHNFIISIMPANRDPLSSMIFLWIAPVDIFRNVFKRYNRQS